MSMNDTEAIREKHIAQQEGHTAHDADDYFKYRPNYERPLNRKHFEEGHRRGYEAGMQQAVKDMEPVLAMVEKLARELWMAIDEINDQKMSKVTCQTETPPDLWDQETLHEAQLVLKEFNQ